MLASTVLASVRHVLRTRGILKNNFYNPYNTLCRDEFTVGTLVIAYDTEGSPLH